MVVARFRKYLSLLTAVVFLSALATLAWSMSAPCQVEVAGPGVRPVGAKPVAPQTAVRLAFGDFEVLLSRRLQAPLFDPPPQKAPALVKKELPPPPVKLLATMPEPGGGCAMFSDTGGGTLVKSRGDQITGGGAPVELVEIADDHVVVRQATRLITMKLPR